MADPQITQLLIDLRHDRRAAIDRLFPLVYEELRRGAHRELGRQRSGETLRTTALVHEAYLKLVDQARADWRDRTHFLATAARAMRHILIDYARGQQALKRGGDRVQVTLNDELTGSEERADTLIALDEALTELAELNPRLGQIVEFRFFGGLKEAEIASVLDISERTVQREWRKAKAWLTRALTGLALEN